MTAYEQGFITKCAEYGVDGMALLKTAKGTTPSREMTAVDIMSSPPPGKVEARPWLWGILSRTSRPRNRTHVAYRMTGAPSVPPVRQAIAEAPGTVSTNSVPPALVAANKSTVQPVR